MNTSTAANRNSQQDSYGKTFLGQPRGLSILFYTEMWERFSYYGMRALLILFMTAGTSGENPGLGLDVGTAAAVYGLYTALVYLLALPGGWIADNLWGQRKAVYVGGWIIMIGHFSMAISSVPSFYLGLILIIVGTGFLKPNISVMVGDLYPDGGASRDAGFSIFYTGINIGALIGPILCSFLGEDYNWHWGFSLAGIGMAFGLFQFKSGLSHLGDVGLLETNLSNKDLTTKSRKFWSGSILLVGLIASFAYMVSAGVIPVSLTQIATGLGTAILVIVALYFGYLMVLGGHSREEKQRLLVILWLFLLSAIFWSGFEQAGSSLNLFAQNLTDRNVFGWLMPAGFLQSVNSAFIIIFSPIFASLWLWLASRNANPSIPVKFGLGLLGLSAGFFVIAWGAVNATLSPVSPAWLIVMYFFFTVGELALSPVGLSSITKLAPKGRVSQMMGIWFVATALGNLFAGLVAGNLETLQPFELFRTVAMTTAAFGLLALVVSRSIDKISGNVT
ncbi:MAG: MFS transporter [Gemmatimonadetes bacterium]|nr:MFS transporter [Gemmatimonadota bacterium]